MEIVIVICLPVIIVLLLQDKMVIRKRLKQNTKEERVNPNLPDIMGQPKPIRSLSVPSTATESHKVEPQIDPSNLDIEYDENENLGIQIPPEELDEVFSNTPDWKDEEAEWAYENGISDDGFAQGVTFEELSAVGILLQKENLEPAQKETTVAIVQKIQGTELFSLLESSLEGASRKIAELLDSSLSTETDNSSSARRKSDFGDFDIGEFV